MVSSPIRLLSSEMSFLAEPMTLSHLADIVGIKRKPLWRIIRTKQVLRHQIAGLGRRASWPVIGCQSSDLSLAALSGCYFDLSNGLGGCVNPCSAPSPNHVTSAWWLSILYFCKSRTHQTLLIEAICTAKANKWGYGISTFVDHRVN